ncbi:Methyltransferase domain-containing protein [Methanobrevibacter millerae]|uniref:Methyltransferase domain-containing protein n=2 Tax=Methanobrevibacter millerae TaxID=230361 RepID=A0A1G5VRP4_9EURY|nr:Methyltransferase domain-containing protein [Methanobrevibacter millerae]
MLYVIYLIRNQKLDCGDKMDAIINEYKKYGVDRFYKLHGHYYENPHKDIVESLLREARTQWKVEGNILDLCCGSGEVSNIFSDCNVEGIDPYTKELYEANTNNNCREMTFKDIVQHGLERQYDFVICSYAMHLCEKSMLPMLLYRISESSDNLVIITPHKKPNCNGDFFKESKRMKKERTLMIWYKNF